MSDVGSMSWTLLFRSSLMKMLVEREVTGVLVRWLVGGGGGETGGSIAGDKDGWLNASIFSSSLTRSQTHGFMTQVRQKCMSRWPSR